MRKLLLFALLLSCMITSAQTVVTDGNCAAAFKFTVNNEVMSIVPATAINFHDRSEGNVSYWFWDFGDGNTSTEENPMFVFPHPIGGANVKISPYKTVSLTVLTSDSCKSMYSEVINIMEGVTYPEYACKAGFKYYQIHYDSIAKTATFQLTNLSVGDSLQYEWNFYDGKISTEREPTVTFDLSQTERKVCLTVRGSNDCTSEFCDALYIYNPDKPVDPQPADCETAFGYTVNYDIKTFAPALVLDFYSKAYPEPVKWMWDFGDGTSSEEANPTKMFNYTLGKDSLLENINPFRTVCLTVETVTGCVASYCEKINIYMDTTPVDTVPQCHAWIKYYSESDVVTIPEMVVYKLIGGSNDKVVSRLWTFEDGTTSTEAEVLKTFDIFKPTQKVSLTINTADGCTSTLWETIYVSGSVPPDSGYVTPPANVYTMRYESSFPEYMSSCAGWAKAQVYMNDSLVKANNYLWSTGTEGQEVKGLCPTEMYTVKAITPDGTYVSGNFLFNSDGTVTDAPFNWWVTGMRDDQIIQYDPANKDFTVEWRLCDGTIVKSDSIPLNSINCGGNESNMIVKDAAGKIVYSENISMKTLTTGINPDKTMPIVKLYPNPVKNVLNLQYSGSGLNEMQLEICDMSGRSVLLQKFYNVESGQQISLNVNSLSKGIYLCKMISGKQVIRIEKFSK